MSDHPDTMADSEFTRDELDAMPAAFVRSLRDDARIPYGYDHPDDYPRDRWNGL